MTITQSVRIVTLVMGAVVCALALLATIRATKLARSQPDAHLSPFVNRLAYVAIMLAGVQSIAVQIARLHQHAPLRWYSSPLSLVWQGMLVVWFVKRVQWHRKEEGL